MDPRKVIPFLNRLVADREAGRDEPLSHYLALYPSEAEEVAREYLRGEDEADRHDGEPPELVRLRRALEGRYEVLRELARGAQGIVYAGESADARQPVAIKVQHCPGLDERDDERFVREAEVAARLDHPGICSVLESGHAGDVAYSVMPFVRGESLAVHIDSWRRGESRAETSDVLRIVELAARALHVAHEAGITHRDIKPANVMVTGDRTPVLLDFGLAKTQQEQLASLTHTGEILGTPAYMSPEQVSGAGQRVDGRTDVWSLGVVLYECLRLRRPFAGATREALLQAIARDGPDLRWVNGGYPNGLRAVLGTALEKDPDRRYQSALDLAEDLANVRTGAPVQARRASASLLLRRWVVRHPVAALLVAGAGAAALGGLSLALHVASVEKDSRRATQRRYEEVRSFANSSLFEFHDAIKDLPGATRARSLLVNRALRYLRGLSAEDASDPAVQRELVAAYLRVGDVQGNPDEANLGDCPGALDSFERAHRLVLALLRDAPLDPDLRMLRAITEARIGSAATAVRGLAAGTRWLEKARRGLVALGTERPAAAFELARVLVKLGLRRSRAHRFGEARKHLDDALGLLATLPPVERSARATELVAAEASFRRGDILRHTADPASALPHYERASRLAESLLASGLRSPKAREIAVRSRLRIGRHYSLYGDRATGLRWLERSVELNAKAAAEDPDDLRTAGLLAEAYRALAVTVIRHDLERARSLLEKSLEALDGFDLSRAGLPFQAAAVKSRETLARALDGLGLRERALEQYGIALRELRDLTGRDPEHLSLRLDLGICLLNRAVAHHRAARYARAEQDVARCLRVFTDLAEQHAKANDVRRNRALALLVQADIRRAAARWDAALALYRSGLRVLRSGPVDPRDDPVTLKGLRGVGFTASKARKLAAAERTYRASIRHVEARLAKDGEDPSLRETLALDLDNVALLLRWQGDPGAAIPLHRRAIEIFRELGDTIRVGKCLRRLGNTGFTAGEHEIAQEAYKSALKLFGEAMRETRGRVGARAAREHRAMLRTHFAKAKRHRGRAAIPPLDGVVFAALELHAARHDAPADLLARYAWALLAGTPERLRDTDRAALAAMRAAEIARPTALVLDTLAAAHYRSGDAQAASEAGRQALALARAEGDEDLRRAISARLKVYGKRASGKRASGKGASGNQRVRDRRR